MLKCLFEKPFSSSSSSSSNNNNNKNNNNNNNNKSNKHLNCHIVFLSKRLKFCFMGIIQQELDQVKQIHNTHKIRSYPNQEYLSGRPNFIYNVSENFGKFMF